MKILTNTSSLRVQRELSQTAKALQRSLSHLASGKRIVQAGDDASGLAISEGLTAQVRGFNQAVRNINDAASTLQVADGALDTQIQILQRMRELAVQSANGTMSNNERNYLNQELQQLVEEFERVTTTTEFQGVKLLDGSLGTVTLQVGAAEGNTIDINLPTIRTSSVFQKHVGTGRFNSRTTRATELSPKALATGDLNGDGYRDLVVGNNSGSVTTMLGAGDGTFSSSRSFAEGESIESVQLADINGDGDLDLISVDSSLYSGTPNVSVRLGKGDGTFDSAVTYAVGSGASSVSIGDLNGDGRADLAIGNRDVNTVSVLLSLGGGTFSSGTTVSVGNTPSVSLGDLNNDGILDMVTADLNDGTVSIARGNGDGTFQARTSISSLDALRVQMNDLNNDGKLDLVVANANDSQVTVFMGRGDLTFGAGQTFATGSDPQNIQVGDVNGDGIKDLLVANGTDGNISVLIGNGNGSFAAQTNFGSGSNTRSLIAADFNGDDILDVITADEGDDTASILIGESQSVSAVNDLSIATQSQARDVLAVLSNAMNYMFGKRALIGAYQSRLDSASESARTTVGALSEARSQILDADYASETADLVRNQILQQAQVTVLGQANLTTQLALQLLGNLR